MSSINGTTLRLTGMSSGLDTDSIVKSLLEVDQLKVDKQFKLKAKLEWTGDAYRAVNTKIKNFRTQYMSVLNSASNMFSASTYKAYSVNMQTSTNAVSITAGSTATEGAMTINKITQLAEPPKITGQCLSTSGTSATLLEALGEDAFGTDGNTSFSLNGEEFTFSSDTTVASMMSTINANSDAGVTVSYSSLKNTITITGKTTGNDQAIEMENSSGDIFNSFFNVAEGAVYGKDAIAQIEGVTVEESSNTFTIDGITYSLKAKSDTAINFSVEKDTDAVYDKIVSFVDAYNTLIEDLQSTIDEEVYSDYEPLTDTEREDLSESQQEKWDEKSKSGLLRNDSGIRSLLQTMRSAFYQTVSDTGKSAASIGLETGSYATTGKIVINEDKLRAAISNNPDEVTKIFTNVSSSTSASTKTAESGLVTRLSNALNTYVSNSVDNTLANNADALSEANDRLDELEDWLSNNEEKYWTKFSAMETAMSQLNSQSSWLSSLLGS